MTLARLRPHPALRCVLEHGLVGLTLLPARLVGVVAGVAASATAAAAQVDDRIVRPMNMYILDNLKHCFDMSSRATQRSSKQYCGGWTGWWLVVPAWRVKLSYYGT